MSKHGLNKIEVSEKLELLCHEYDSANSLLQAIDLKTMKIYMIILFCLFFIVYSPLVIVSIVSAEKIANTWLYLGSLFFAFVTLAFIDGFILWIYFSRKKACLNAEKVLADPVAKTYAQLVSLARGYNDIVVRLTENEELVNSFDESLLQAMQRVYKSLKEINEELCSEPINFCVIKQLHEAMKDDLIFLKLLPKV